MHEDNDMDTLSYSSKKLSLKEPDDWFQIFCKISEYRKQKGISAAALIRSFNLPSQCVQFLFSTKLIPSRRPGTVGERLRSTIREFLKEKNIENGEGDEEKNIIKASFKDLILDFSIEKTDLLHSIGVSSLFADEKNNEKIVKIVVMDDICGEKAKSMLKQYKLFEECKLEVIKTKYLSRTSSYHEDYED